MTDTIGWGDVDVEPSRRRRRLPPVPRRVGWPLAAVVVAAVVLVPRAEAHLADDSAAWLQREWRLATAYDSTRTTIVAGATEHAAASDSALFAGVVTAVDRDEAAQLARIAASMGHRRGWSGDVRRALGAARSAVSAEARDLRAQAARPDVAFSGSFYASTLWSARTQGMVAAADRLVTTTARRHHVRATSPPPRAPLTGASAALAQLARLTPQPLPLRLVLSHDGDVDVWNLQDGSVRRNVASIPIDSSFSVRRVGLSVLGLSPGGHWVLIPADGGRATTLPPAADYLPAGDNGMWQFDGSVVRRLDRSGRQIGRTYSMPAGFGAPFGSTPDALIVARETPDAGTFPFVWTPDTGSLRAVPDACNAGEVGAGHRVVYVPCRPVQHLAVMDTRTGAVRQLASPDGMQVLDGTELLSPDGRRVAALTSPAGTVDDGSPSTLTVWDLDSGEHELLPQSANAIAWSPDGSVLVVDTNVSSTNSTSDLPLAYWTWGTTALVPIRIPLSDASGTAVLLPARS